MALFDSLTFITLAIVVGGSVGIGMGKLYRFYLKNQEKKKAFKFIKGEIPNNYNLDGEKININKFITKENNGKIIKMGIVDIHKNVLSQALNKQKQPFLKRKEVK